MELTITKGRKKRWEKQLKRPNAPLKLSGKICKCHAIKLPGKTPGSFQWCLKDGLDGDYWNRGDTTTKKSQRRNIRAKRKELHEHVDKLNVINVERALHKVDCATIEELLDAIIINDGSLLQLLLKLF